MGKLADGNDAYDQGLAPAIAGANNTDWSMNEDSENDESKLDNLHSLILNICLIYR